MPEPLDQFLDTAIFDKIESNHQYERFEDMSPDGKLVVILQQDGDSILTIWPGKENRRHAYASVEFCSHSGGGKSPRVRKAIVALAEAIRLDNEERKQFRG